MARKAKMENYILLMRELMQSAIRGEFTTEPKIGPTQCRKHSVNQRVGSYTFKAMCKYGVFHKEQGTGKYYFKAPAGFSIGKPGTAEEIYSIAKEMYYKEHPYVPKEKSPKKFSINKDSPITMGKKETTLSEASLDEIFEEIKSRGYIMYITKAWLTTGKEYLTVRLKLGAW